MVYFLQGTVTKNIKIGSTNNLPQRMGNLYSSDRLVCIKTCDGGSNEEMCIQRRFRHLHVHGEWFSPGLELLNFIESLPDTEFTGLKQRVKTIAKSSSHKRLKPNKNHTIARKKPGPKRPRIRIDIDSVYDRIASGESIRGIARDIGCSAALIHKRMKREQAILNDLFTRNYSTQKINKENS